ncbi:hypothetical protein ABPG77_003611 [Micractinium sp. CCAP 211/92]
MAFEMSLPHAPRIQAVGADGAETLAQDEQQWDIYFTVQKALEMQQEGRDGSEADDAGKADATPETAQAPQPSDPGRVLEKLLTARGELDVICDLVTFVEQQQFLAVAGIHRQQPSLEERVRARALRLAASKAALRRAAERLAGGTAALRAQEVVENRFLADLAQLRRRWRLARHAGEGGMFYADISLPLRGPAGEGVAQEGAHCNIVMDTNGDACIVEAVAAAMEVDAPGSRPTPAGSATPAGATAQPAVALDSSSDPMLSSAAKDILAAEARPGFQQRFEGSLRAWAAAAPGRALRRLESGEEFAAVWQLLGCKAAGAAPVLAIAVDDCLRLEGVSSRGVAPLRPRGLTRAELERQLQCL